MKKFIVSVFLVGALIVIGANSVRATHTPVSSDVGAARIKIELLDASGTTPLSTSGPNPVTLTAPENLICAQVPVGDLADPAGSTRCFFGPLITFSPTSGTGTVQILDKTLTAVAKMVATAGLTTNDFRFKNFTIKNNSTVAVTVRLSGEFNFPDNANAINGSGRAHGFGCKGTFFASSVSATANDNAVCNGEFVYFDDNLTNFKSEATGGLPDAGVSVSYTPSGAFGSNTFTKCVAEGSTGTSCPNNPTILTACPNNFGTCLPLENLFLSQAFKLQPSHRVEVGAGNTSQSTGGEDASCQLVAAQGSESFLSCALHQNESLNLDSGCVHVEVYGSADVNLSTCDFSGARFGAGGFELGPPQQVNCGLNLNKSGGKNDCLLSFCPSSHSGFACGDGDVTTQLTVSCDVNATCQEAVVRGNRIRIVSEDSGTFEDQQLACSMPGTVTPCK